MKHLKQAKTFASKQKGQIFSLLLLYCLFALLAGFIAAYIPFIGWLLTILLDIYAITLLCVGFRDILQSQKIEWGSLISKSFTTLMDKSGPIGFGYLVNIGMLLPAFLLLFILTFGMVASLFQLGFGAPVYLDNYNYLASNVTGFFFWFFLFVLALIVFCFYAFYVEYRYTYKVMAAVCNKEVQLNDYNMDMVKMGCISALWFLVPFVGIVFYFIWYAYYMTKIAIDVQNMPDEIEEKVEAFHDPVQPSTKEEVVVEVEEEIIEDDEEEEVPVSVEGDMVEEMVDEIPEDESNAPSQQKNTYLNNLK